MSQRKSWIASVVTLSSAVALAAPLLARAHAGLESAPGFWSAFAHPWSGLDHVCAMLAVGIWAGQHGGHARWILPSSFVAVMSLGGAIALFGASQLGVEAGILASLLVLGGLVAAAVRVPVGLAAGIVAAFALFHGHAHGAELAAGGATLSGAFGVACATALLHALGVAMAKVAARASNGALLRFSGAAITLFGVYLLSVG